MHLRTCILEALQIWRYSLSACLLSIKCSGSDYRSLSRCNEHRTTRSTTLRPHHQTTTFSCPVTPVDSINRKAQHKTLTVSIQDTVRVASMRCTATIDFGISQMRTLPPPLRSDETLAEEFSKLVSDDHTPLQNITHEFPNIDTPEASETEYSSEAMSNRLGLRLRSFPECLDRPDTFQGIKSSQIRPNTTDQSVVRIFFITIIRFKIRSL
jgi:hypothetical protein